jgi:hypothetical protein
MFVRVLMNLQTIVIDSHIQFMTDQTKAYNHANIIIIIVKLMKKAHERNHGREGVCISDPVQFSHQISLITSGRYDTEVINSAPIFFFHLCRAARVVEDRRACGGDDNFR